MATPRYTVYDTEAGKYLERATEMPGWPGVLVTDWTRRPERAQRFPGVKSARRMVDKLGRDQALVIKNERGEIIA